MKLLIGENLRRLRREKNITQEELAEVLGVSYQSVSRWENGACYPDMELLPTLAAFFSVSVDTLLGADEAVEKTRVADYLARFQEAISVGDVEMCIAVAREGVAEYPNNYALLNKLMYALFIATDEDGNVPDWRENMQKYDAEITALGERIMKYCPDADLRHEAMYRLAFNHCEMGRRAKGREIFEMLPSQRWCREANLWWALEPEEKLPYTYKMVMSSYDMLYWAISRFVGARLLPDEQQLQVLDKLQALRGVVWDDVRADAEWDAANSAFKRAEILARLGQTEAALAELEIGARHAASFDARPEAETFSSLLLGEVTIRRTDFETSDNRSLREIYRDKWLAAKDFDALRDSEGFRRILSLLG